MKDIAKDPLEEKIKERADDSKKSAQGIKTIKRSLFSTKKRLIISSIVGLIVLLAILTALPFTRYPIYGLFVKKDAQIIVVDAVSKAPVSGVTVKLGNVSATTDSKGIATLHGVAVGNYNISISKKFYSNASAAYTVSLFTAPKSVTENLTPTGRPLTITVSNLVSTKGLANAKLAVDGSSSLTDGDGKATLVVSPDIDKQTITVSADGYNNATLNIDLARTTTYSTNLTPAGKIFYLSNLTGIVNVMTANLDGSSPQVAIPGNQAASSYAPSLLASRDWKYAAYTANLDDNPSIYITDANGNYSKISTGDNAYQPIGWSGHTFFFEYTVNNTDIYLTQYRDLIKAYDADTKKMTTIDQNLVKGGSSDPAYQYYTTPVIVQGNLFYIRSWVMGKFSFPAQSKTSQAIEVDGSTLSSKVLKEWTIENGKAQPYAIQTRYYEPDGVYIRITNDPGFDLEFAEYEARAIKQITIDDDTYYQGYPTYLLSPTNNQTFWYANRDGKNTLLIGDSNADNAKQIATLSEYTPYGWFGDSDQYILLQKNGSELYIATPGTVDQPVKITDYYRGQSLNGYGAGYGGQ